MLGDSFESDALIELEWLARRSRGSRGGSYFSPGSVRVFRVLSWVGRGCGANLAPFSAGQPPVFLHPTPILHVARVAHEKSRAPRQNSPRFARTFPALCRCQWSCRKSIPSRRAPQSTPFARARWVGRQQKSRSRHVDARRTLDGRTNERILEPTRPRASSLRVSQPAASHPACQTDGRLDEIRRYKLQVCNGRI